MYDGKERQFMKGKHTWLDYLSFFRWIVNALFVGIPWFGFSISMFIVNIAGNIWLNKWWSDGNPLLIMSTIYLGL